MNQTREEACVGRAEIRIFYFFDKLRFCGDKSVVPNIVSNDTFETGFRQKKIRIDESEVKKRRMTRA